MHIFFIFFRVIRYIELKRKYFENQCFFDKYIKEYSNAFEITLYRNINWKFPLRRKASLTLHNVPFIPKHFENSMKIFLIILILYVSILWENDTYVTLLYSYNRKWRFKSLSIINCQGNDRSEVYKVCLF